jgi:hypothetical protein
VEALVPYELGVVVTLATLAVEVVSVVSVEVVMEEVDVVVAWNEISTDYVYADVLTSNSLTLEVESNCVRWEREQDRSE